ncbi:MAG: MFS transporter [Actinobacteria bacterium]|nr:MAG: MFS transporter [Actinomycetota bacterium]
MVRESIAPAASRSNRAPTSACNHARTMEVPPLQPPRSSPIAEDEARRIPPLLAGYWSFGQYWGTWVIVVVELNRHRGLSYGRNGLLLALLSIVAVLVMTFGAPRLTRFPISGLIAGSLTTLGVGAVAMAVLSTGTLWIAFILVGAGNGLIDVFLNVEAQRVEVATGAGLLLFLTAAWNARRGANTRAQAGDPSTFSLSAFRRHPTLWVPALVILFAFLVEGSMDTWSGLYLQDELGASSSKAAVAFAAFSASLCIGRLFAGRVLFGFGRRITIVLSGIGAAIGGGVAAATSSPAVVAVAFLILGFAISASAPAAFGLVDEAAPGDQANGVAAVTTVGYSGFVWSPPIFGWIAQAFDLRAAMVVIVSTTAGIVVAGWLAPRAGRDVTTD